MRFSGATLFPLLVLAVLAAATFWLEQASQGETSAPRARDRHDPDYWVDGVQLRGFDAKGAPRHELKARRLEHFPDNDTTLVFEPRLKYLEEPRDVGRGQAGLGGQARRPRAAGRRCRDRPP